MRVVNIDLRNHPLTLLLYLTLLFLSRFLQGRFRKQSSYNFHSLKFSIHI